MTRPLARSIAAMGAATLLLSGAASLVVSQAAADTPPPWEVGAAKDANEVGSVRLYDSSGNQVTSGSVLDSPIALYMVGSTSDTTHPKATAYMYTPEFGTAAGAWPGEQLTLSTAYPVAGAGVPSVVSSATGPVVTGHDTDESIGTYIEDFPNTDTTDTGYPNAYQLRVKTSSDGTYQSLDIAVSGLTMSGGTVTGGTWTETYPGIGPTATTTVLAVSPSSAKQGKAVTLTATESAGAVHAAGSVQFGDNGKKLGSPVPLSTSSGIATMKTKKLPPGKNVIRATFTPTDTSSYSSSVSATKTVKITAARLKNTKKPTLSGPHKVGRTETVTPGKWSPKPSRFSYRWFLGAKKIRGATKSTYKPTKGDAGKKLSCTVTAKKTGFKPGRASSARVKVKT